MLEQDRQQRPEGSDSLKMSETAQIVDSVPDRVQSTKIRGRKRNPVQIAMDMSVKAMLAKGLSIRQVAGAMNISASTVQRVKDLTKEEDQITGLVSQARDAKTAKLIDHFLDKGTKLRSVKGSDALGAAKLYSDRRWPTKNEQTPTNISFVEINIQEVRVDPSSPQPIDITPGHNDDSQPLD